MSLEEAFNNSAGMLSGPAALLLLSFLIASSTSEVVIGVFNVLSDVVNGVTIGVPAYFVVKNVFRMSSLSLSFSNICPSVFLTIIGLLSLGFIIFLCLKSFIL